MGSVITSGFSNQLRYNNKTKCGEKVPDIDVQKPPQEDEI